MSRIGKKPITVPSGVDVKIDGATVRVKGPKGELSHALAAAVSVALADGVVSVSVRDQESVDERALWGLTRQLIVNMIEGVTKGFERKLEINGVGFKAAVQGDTLKLDVGFSHEVEFVAPKGIKVAVEKNVITVSGIDKETVGQVAAQIRGIKKPEPYKGKGIKYADETIRRKAGKSAKAGSSA